MRWQELTACSAAVLTELIDGTGSSGYLLRVWHSAVFKGASVVSGKIGQKRLQK